MKVNKILATLIAVVMIVACMSVAAFADNGNVAKIGNTEYATLKEAVAAAPNNNTPTTITLLKSSEGDGINFNNGQNVIIDFAGYTYTVTGQTVGSTGTVTQGFRMLKGSTVTLMNGTAKAGADTENLVQFFHTYSDVTLSDFTVDATENSRTKIALEADCGTLNINGNSSILAYSGETGLYAAYWHNATYDGTTVNVNTTGNITGKLVYEWDDDTNNPETNKGYLNISNGTLDITGIDVLFSDNVPENLRTANISITGGTFSDASALKYLGDNANVTIKNATYSGDELNVIGNKTVNIDGGTYTFSSWGFEAAGTGAKLTLSDVTVNALEACVVGQQGGAVVINSGTFTSTDNFVVGTQGSAGNGGSNITINDGTFNGSITTNGYVACGIYAANDDVWNINGGTFNITGGAGIVARAGVVTVADGVTINTSGNVTGKIGDSRVVVPCSALVFDSEANYPGLTGNSVINVTGGNFTSDGAVAIKVVGTDNARINVTGGTFSSEPSSYVADGYEATQNGSSWTVAEKAACTEHDHGDTEGKVSWRVINGQYSAVVTYVCTNCGKTYTVAATVTNDTTTVPGSTIYTAKINDAEVGSMTKKNTYTVTFMPTNGQTLSDEYGWGEICTLTSTDNTPKAWRVGADENNLTTVADGTSTYSFAVTEDITVWEKYTDNTVQQPIVSVKFRETSDAGKAIFNAKWSLPTDAKVTSVTAYYGYGENSNPENYGKTIIAKADSYNSVLRSTNGDLTVNITDVPAGEYVHAYIDIVYTLGNNTYTLTNTTIAVSSQISNS